MAKLQSAAVKVNHVTKSFTIPLEGSTGLKQKLINHMKGRSGYRNFTPLNDINFEIKKGEFFGIVGRNGSGKSTLLKTIAGIYTPNKGSVNVSGTLVPFIELGVGFNPELSGRENVYLNGALLGFSHEEMHDMYKDIIEFAELEDFMDERLKNYSSGMQVRLAFSIAIRARADILLLDEVLAVGDEAFQRKCYSYFAQLKKEKKTVILVTHDMGSIQRFCSSAMLLDKGKIVEFGDIEKVTEKYQELNQPKQAILVNKTESSSKYAVKINTIIKNQSVLTNIFSPRDKKISFINTIIAKEEIKDAFFGFTIWNESGNLMYWFTTEKPNKQIPSILKNKELTLKLNIQNIFGDGNYYISTVIKSMDRTVEYAVNNHSQEFTVTGHGTNGWVLHPDMDFSMEVN